MPLQGHLRSDNEHVRNAVSTHFRAEEEGREAAGEPQLLHPGHGDLDLEKNSLMFFPFCSIAFNLQLLDLLGIFFLGGFLVNRWLENLAAKWMT